MKWKKLRPDAAASTKYIVTGRFAVMEKFEVDFSINGKRYQQIVTANDSAHAQKKIQVQYASAKLEFFDVKPIK
jgi:hypothetical protein